MIWQKSTQMTNKNKIILDLCGGTGAWSRPYAEHGYDVRLITLPEYDVRDYEPPENVYGILAAPPCTEFSLAKGSAPRNFRLGMEIVEACLHIIWKCRFQAPLAFWCLENPRGFLRQFLGKPSMTVRYWEFGDNISKPTDLWGYFNEPKRKYTEPPALLQKINNMPNDGGVTRAITPPAFAQAFFEANP